MRHVEPERFLVLQWIPAKSTWAFGLYPLAGGSTRLVSRNRLPGSGPFFWLGMVAFMEPGSLIMERKMLLGIKQRAERMDFNVDIDAELMPGVKAYGAASLSADLEVAVSFDGWD